MIRRALRVSVVAAATAAGIGGGVIVAASPAGATQALQQLSCSNGATLTIRGNNNNSSDMGGWSAAQILDGGSGHLVPTSFSGSAVDTTANVVLFSFSQTKGNGNANQNQQPIITCGQQGTMTLADLIAQNGPPPGGQLPPGTSLDDTVVQTFAATAVQHS
jgi:hypothetical protein